MTLKRKEIREAAFKAIKTENIFFMEDVISFLPCSKSYFYKAFPIGGKDSEEMKTILNDNKVITKAKIRKKLFQSEKASELLSLYRLICTPEERQNLNQQYIEHRNVGKEVTGFSFAEDTKTSTTPKEGKQKKLA